MPTTLEKADPGLKIAALYKQWSTWLYLALLVVLCLIQAAAGLTPALSTALIGAWFLWLSRMKPQPVRSSILGIFILVFVSAPRPMGYDRLGYAFLFLIVFEQLGAFLYGKVAYEFSFETRGKVYFWSGVSTGAALVCLLLTKASFAAPAFVLLSLGLLLFGVDRRHLCGMMTGALAALVAVAPLLHVHPSVYPSQLHAVTGHAAAAGRNLLHVMVDEVGQELFTLAAGLAVVFTGRLGQRVSRQYMVATAVILACDLVCRATTPVKSTLPLAAFWDLCGAVLLLTCHTARERKTAKQQRMVALLALGPLTAQLFLVDLSSSVYMAYKALAVQGQAIFQLADPPSRQETIAQSEQPQ